MAWDGQAGDVRKLVGRRTEQLRRERGLHAAGVQAEVWTAVDLE